MSYSLPAYSEYRAADLPWLGCVPATWKIKRAKSYFSLIDLRSKEGAEELLTVSASDGIRKRREKAVTMFQAASYAGHKLCWPGDLVVNSLWAWATGLGFSQYHGIVSTAYSVYRLRPELADDFEYFHHLLRSRAYDWEFTVRSKGIWISRLQLTDESFFDMPILLQPNEDRKAIVRFVRHLDLRVNRLLKTKRRLIELLTEQKQAIIHRAVTRGLDPDVPLKSSGVEWLGDVPMHWAVLRLKQVASIALSNVDKKSVEGEVKVRLCNYTDVYYNSEITSSLNFMEATAPSDQAKRFQLKVGDVLITKDSETPEDIAVPAIVTEALDGVVCGYHLAMLRPKKLLQGKYLAHVLANSPCRDHFHTSAHGVTRYGLSLDGIGTAPILLPPLAEQNEIADYIGRETAPFEKAIAKAKSEIDFIREYRTRLVSDVVTGQLDVRGLALPEVEDVKDNLSDEAEEGDELPGEEPEGDDE